MTKIIFPNKGTVETNGKLTSLLELGAGFHQDFTGRENIYFNASIFGLTRKEIDERIQDIIDFSELCDFFDHPVRTYSSGMYMRLAFSVAINVDAEFLKNMYQNLQIFNLGSSLDEMSKNIFTDLRKADKTNAELIIIQGVSTDGLGLAIMNRLLRACNLNIIR